MKKYKIITKESIEKEITISASSKEEAEKMFYNGKIEMNDFKQIDGSEEVVLEDIQEVNE